MRFVGALVVALLIGYVVLMVHLLDEADKNGKRCLMYGKVLVCEDK